jgi:hypothetical protein
VCVCVCLKGDVFTRVWVCKLARAHLCATLSVNDSSVAMYIGESGPNFMVQRGNSVIPCAVCLYVTPIIFSSCIHVDICVTEYTWESQSLCSLAKLWCPIACLAHVIFCTFVGCYSNVFSY